MVMRSVLKWLLCIPALMLVGLVAAEKSGRLRSDSLEAVLCTPELLRATPDIPTLLGEFRAQIDTHAREIDLPPELLAAIIYGHQSTLTQFRHFTDCAGSALGRDLSLGLAQVRISTAVSADRLPYDSLPHRDFKQYRATLLDPDRNIAYQASVLRQLLDRDIRYPGITADTLVHDPFAMALLMSEYRAGPQHVAAEESRLSANAFYDLSFMLDDAVFIFGRDTGESRLIRQQVQDYLDFIYCDSGIFNQGVCENWQDR
jgi:hypothetical protein